jgi:hypothetical protein
LRLAHFRDEPRVLLNLQNLYELRLAEAKSGSAIKKLPRLKRVGRTFTHRYVDQKRHCQLDNLGNPLSSQADRDASPFPKERPVRSRQRGSYDELATRFAHGAKGMWMISRWKVATCTGIDDTDVSGFSHVNDANSNQRAVMGLMVSLKLG